MNNQAFIDGQNLYFSTMHSELPWKVDIFRFREYLCRKFGIEQVYYFLGCFDNEQKTMYDRLREAGYILVFREHQRGVLSRKKGNVDTDIVFCIMCKLYKCENIGKIFLISGDGDYYRMVEFLCDEGKLGKIIFPSRKNASSLYRQIMQRYKMYLDDPDVRRKIAYEKGV